MKNLKTQHSETRLAQIESARTLGTAASHHKALQRMAEYNAHPNHCLQCQTALLIPLEKMNPSGFQQVKDKKFCNQSCGAKYNMARIAFPRNKPKSRICSQCGVVYTKYKNRLNRCQPCVQTYLSRLQLKTKAECNLETIRGHARATLLKTKPPICEVCGYSFHVDCCHIKPIGGFPPTALVGEINAISNLAALCKNHHDELDKGAISLATP